MHVLEKYLPREQTKMNLISQKVFEIFYEEFVKFVPPYILKKEEEKRNENKNSPKSNLNVLLQIQQIPYNTVRKGITKVNSTNAVGKAN